MNWLPQYADGLKYLAILFPMFLYEGKMALLILTYLKTLRKEKIILKVNIISLFLGFVLTLIFTTFHQNLNLLVLSILIVLAFRSALAEYCLTKTLKIRVFKDIVLEFIMSAGFVFISWMYNSWYSTILYAVLFILYTLVKLKVLLNSKGEIFKLIKR